MDKICVYAYDEIATENMKKDFKNGNKGIFYTNFRQIYGLEMQFAALEGEMIKEGTLTSSAYVYKITHIAVLRLMHNH